MLALLKMYACTRVAGTVAVCSFQASGDWLGEQVSS